jgi:hypothetical protein
MPAESSATREWTVASVASRAASLVTSPTRRAAPNSDGEAISRSTPNRIVGPFAAEPMGTLIYWRGGSSTPKAIADRSGEIRSVCARRSHQEKSEL